MKNDSTKNQPMDDFKIKDNWTEHLKNLKEQFPNVNFDDLEFVPDDEIELLEKLELKLGKPRIEIINIIRLGVA